MHPTRHLRQSASLLSTVHRGTAFENRSLRILQDNLSMVLTRVGGRADGGVDLAGWWWLPDMLPGTTAPHARWCPEGGEGSDVPSSTASTSPDNPGDAEPSTPPARRLRVLAQCKAEKKKMGPGYVRELEGVVYRHTAKAHPSPSPSPPEHAPAPIVALLVSQSPFTRLCLLAAQSSPVPLFLLNLPAESDSDASADEFGMAFWNPALASAKGLLGGEIDLRWERALAGGARPGLWWRGRRMGDWVPKLPDISE